MPSEIPSAAPEKSYKARRHATLLLPFFSTVGKVPICGQDPLLGSEGGCRDRSQVSSKKSFLPLLPCLKPSAPASPLLSIQKLSTTAKARVPGLRVFLEAVLLAAGKKHKAQLSCSSHPCWRARPSLQEDRAGRPGSSSEGLQAASGKHLPHACRFRPRAQQAGRRAGLLVAHQPRLGLGLSPLPCSVRLCWPCSSQVSEGQAWVRHLYLGFTSVWRATPKRFSGFPGPQDGTTCAWWSE